MALATSDYSNVQPDAAYLGNFVYAGIGAIAFQVTVTDSYAIADGAGRGIIKAVTDILAFSETASRLMHYGRNFTDTILLSEQFVMAGVSIKQLFKAVRRIFTFKEQKRGDRSGL